MIRSHCRTALGDWPKALDVRVQTVMGSDAPRSSRVDVALALIVEHVQREQVSA